ncbi:MAG TPA: penicillin acylase family protein, partial [Terriglobales bacterium]|nr:penicillin acylase family protein [Terriglobales bacterium]
MVLLVVLLIAGLGVAIYRAGHASLAQMDGTIAVPGLKAPVTVVRDAQGVPHMTAANLEDLFFAQGYVTAQDRLWQMDMTRRLVGGESAEILPQSTGNWLQRDRRQRILRMRVTAEKIAQQLPERDRRFFEAYARGVNTYIEQNRGHLPLEFRVLRYAPKPWTVTDSVLVGIGMSQLLNPQYETEYWRGKLADQLSPELMADLYPVGSPRDHAPGDDGTVGAQAGAAWPRDPSPRMASVVHTLRGLSADLSKDRDGCEACAAGSNNWVVSGAHTVSGKPLLANDMHLPHGVPGIWYEVQLHSGDFNVVGFSLPGTPYVVVGHNQRIAWGFTNLNPDVQDLFVENFNAKGEYQTPKGWEKPEVDHEVIHVTGRPDIVLDVLVTRHGPVISSFFPGETRRLALQWLVYDTKAITIPVFDLDTAQNWEQFRAALSRFTTPSQNVVYADVDGHIGYQAMGFVPVRAS